MILGKSGLSLRAINDEWFSFVVSFDSSGTRLIDFERSPTNERRRRICGRHSVEQRFEGGMLETLVQSFEHSADGLMGSRYRAIGE